MKNWLNVDFTSPNPSKGGERTARKALQTTHCRQLPLLWRGQGGGASIVLRHCGLDPQSVAYEASLQEIAGQARNDGRGQRTQINKSTNNQINKKKKIK